MAHTLAWRYLGPEDTHKCLNAEDVSSIREVLLAADNGKNEGIFSVREYNEGQRLILLDMLAHLILFTKSRSMSPDKVSTLVGIMLHLHEESMSKSYSRAQSYHELRELMVRHSVPRPPFSCGIFTVRDVQDIDEYLLHSYFRHYKMYVYAFVPQRVAHLRSINVGHVHAIPPLSLPALTTAIPQAEWRAKVEREHQQAEQQLMEEEDNRSAANEEERRRQWLENGVQLSEGLKEQLFAIKNEVADMAVERLDQIEARLAEIEKKVDEHNQRPESKYNKRKK
ncbi:putative Flagellar C1a complex subunit C1a 32 [Trypanosoma vivax]|uniref:Flagellar C1a complex subunit C1a-32 n=1 Tax=Trypanosoma vivax (strain Y486) TaxID=1055687 RepID=G0U6J1_TRYVY|nr:hypothetical protein TRVL_02152 [Trypanosoma vivax]KAH8611886.1 putative Flagellar C1a complex subunit C1a 32 [Trypanosoma vivax]CCC51495.1 conserved hypothetical protein [Trypanosoma vivax Y486]